MSKLSIDNKLIETKCKNTSYDIMDIIVKLASAASEAIDKEFKEDTKENIQKHAQARILIDQIGLSAHHYFEVVDLTGVEFQTDCVLHNDGVYK